MTGTSPTAPSAAPGTRCSSVRTPTAPGEPGGSPGAGATTHRPGISVLGLLVPECGGRPPKTSSPRASRFHPKCFVRCRAFTRGRRGIERFVFLSFVFMIVTARMGGTLSGDGDARAGGHRQGPGGGGSPWSSRSVVLNLPPPKSAPLPPPLASLTPTSCRLWRWGRRAAPHLTDGRWLLPACPSRSLRRAGPPFGVTAPPRPRLVPVGLRAAPVPRPPAWRPADVPSVAVMFCLAPGATASSAWTPWWAPGPRGESRP